MNVVLSVIFQIAAMIVQGGNFFTSIVPDKYKGILFIVVGFAQVVLAYKTHFFNPDGTPASTPYVPPAK